MRGNQSRVSGCDCVADGLSGDPAHIGGTFDVLPWRDVAEGSAGLRCRGEHRWISLPTPHGWKEGILSTCQSDGDGEDRRTRTGSRTGDRLAQAGTSQDLPPHQSPVLQR